ncbi:MAG: flagellar biosynthesis protein FlhF [Capsulimonas sp.]|uniref:flagellar biosynthesis protein FlhF n=1 Tax=Capsulimonas sp. TaxID=2494211 RepID=UPI00326791C5
MPNMLFASQRSALADARQDRRVTPAMRVKSITGTTISQCLLQAKIELGSDAVILSKRTVRKGGFFGLGGKNMIEVTFGVTDDSAQSDANAGYIQKLESQIATLSTSVQALIDSSGKRKWNDYPPVGAVEPDGMTGDLVSRRGRGKAAEAPSDPYAGLSRQLLEADIAAPLVRQLISEIPPGLTTATATSELRTLLSQKLLIANRVEIQPGGKLRVLAFVGTTGVGKTTTIAKLAAQYSLVERRKVGVITMDTQRIAAAQQLQTYGDILRVPVKIAHDKSEMVSQLSEFARQGMELVLLDTAGRSPNDMLPLSETADLFDGVGVVQKFLAVPATLSPRDMDNVVGRFYNTLAPDALILTKLDEATDSACFGKLLTMQAKYGIPLAYVTTGQKVPDDIAFPDSHAIAARILSTAIL